jgi:hypothetical protein
MLTAGARLISLGVRARHSRARGTGLLAAHGFSLLSGQEFGTGNHRAFAALDPCRKDGDECTSGIDCCGGYCTITQAAELVEPVGTCSPMKIMCAKRDERCTTTADCCPPIGNEEPLVCIAGFCTVVPPPL